MPLCRSAVVGLSVCLTFALGPPAWATIDNLKSYKQAYPGQEPKAYSCKVCHQGIMGKKGDLNAYGLALQTLKGEGNAKKLTEEDLRAVEQDDADEDGAANLDEMNAGTAPGDPASVPPTSQGTSTGTSEQTIVGRGKTSGVESNSKEVTP